MTVAGKAEVSFVDTLLAEATVLLVAGPGGVGKTTLSAALAARAARDHGRKALVVTVDPARRLADALRISAPQRDIIAEPHIPADHGHLEILCF